MKTSSMRVSLLLLSLVNIVLSCSQKSKSLLLEGPMTNQFTRDIPRTKKGRPTFFYAITTLQAKKLNIGTIDSGFNNLQIRIWTDYSFRRLHELLIITHAQGSWKAKACKIVFHSNDTMANWSYAIIDQKQVQPKHGWVRLGQGLDKLNIMTLPDCNSIPGCGMGEDGDVYIVEIATNRLYRFYTYWMPEVYQEKSWQCMNMVKIVKLVEEEFNIKFDPERLAISK